MPHQQPVVPVQTADGHVFELIRVPAAGASKRLLFLPGMGLSARQYIDFGQALARRGVEVFIHEWRGIGSSSLRADRRHDWGYAELLQQDLDAALNALSCDDDGQGCIIGGHSLGSQLACLLAAMRPEACAGVLIVAGGSPYWRQFSGWMRWILATMFVGMPALSGLLGHYPGRRLGFAGREARGVIRDWTASGRSGRYAPKGLTVDLESGLRALEVPTLAIHMQDDWFVPQASLTWLLTKLSSSPISQSTLDGRLLQGAADHYRWMREPEPAVERIGQWLQCFGEIKTNNQT